MRAVQNSPLLLRIDDQIEHDSSNIRSSHLGHMMAKNTGKTSQAEIDRRFLLQSLNRLKDPDQRYMFTLIADLVSRGLAATEARRLVKPAP